MAKLQFNVKKELHKELATTCSKLGMRRPNFYADCMEKGLDEHRRCIEQSDWRDLHEKVARAIYEKTDTAEDHEQDFSIEVDNLIIEGSIGFESNQTHIETREEPAEYKTTVISLLVNVYDTEKEKDINIKEELIEEIINDSL
jgi:hypothetical protein